MAQAVRSKTATVSKYLDTLAGMGIVDRRLPVGAAPTARGGHWHLRDPFFRFWFRFVFPFQDELENGLGPADLFDATIAPALNEHVSIEFEQWCRRWTRTNRGTVVSRVGSWWGSADREAKVGHGRQSEEIDIVGLGSGRRGIVGEAKWQKRKLDVGILSDLEAFKLPALRADGYRLEDPEILLLLFARSGYTRSLVDAAASNRRLTLVDVATELGHALGEAVN